MITQAKKLSNQKYAAAKKRDAILADPNSEKPLRELLDSVPIDAGNSLADLLVKTKRDPEATSRERTMREAWWFPVAECRKLEVIGEEPGLFTYRIEVTTNQRLNPGDVEAIFSHGIPAMHEARGEKIPKDLVYLPDSEKVPNRRPVTSRNLIQRTHAKAE